MSHYRRSSHTAHDLKVHLVWCTKYRYEVLTKKVRLRIREFVRQVCDERDIQIIKGRVNKEYKQHISYANQRTVSMRSGLIKESILLALTDIPGYPVSWKRRKPCSQETHKSAPCPSNKCRNTCVPGTGFLFQRNSQNSSPCKTMVR